MLSDEQLKGIGAQALNMALHAAELSGRFDPVLAAYKASEVPPLCRLSKVEALIRERLGENWLDSGERKNIAFRSLRAMVDVLPPDAVIVVTLCNGFSPTKKFRELDPAKQEEIVHAGHDGCHRAVKDGLMTVEEVVAALVQTPERVCRYQQKVKRGRLIGQPGAVFWLQEQYDGRTKMFGKHYNYNCDATA